MSIPSERWRCLSVGCNPVLDVTTAQAHRVATGHRVARWPVRSAEGRRRARVRNRTGYYDKYNVGEKVYSERVAAGHIREDDRSGSVGVSLEDFS